MMKLLPLLFLCFASITLQEQCSVTTLITLTTTLTISQTPTTASTTNCQSPTYTSSIDSRCLSQEICCPTDQHPQWNQKSNNCVCVLNPTTYPSIEPTSTSTATISTSTSTTEPPTDCATGTPSTVDSYAIYGVQVTPIPSPGVTNVVPLDQWERRLRITTTSIWNQPSPTPAKAFAEYKCQQACARKPSADLTVPGCQSWFVGLNKATNFWTCSTYAKMITSALLVPAPGPSNSSLTDGVAWNVLCGSDSPCTTGLPVTLNQSTITYAQVTPTEPLPVTGTLQGYAVETGFKDKYSISEHDIVLTQDKQNDALMACQSFCTGSCASWFVGFFLKGAGGYFWRCTQFSELLTPGQMIPTNFSNFVNSTAWNEICEA